MADETAFFRFDTNANEVASNIAGAMGRIQSALAQGDTFDQGFLRTNTQAITQGFTRMEQDVRGSVGRVQQLMNQLQSGQIRTPEFATRLQQEIGEGLSGIRTRMGREMAGLPDVIFNRLPIQELGRDAADKYVSTVLDTVRSRRGELGDLLRDPETNRQIPLNKAMYRSDIGAAGQMSFDSPTLDRTEQLRAIVRAEQLMRQAISDGYDVASMRRPLPEWNASGMGEFTMRQRDRAIEEGRLSFDQDDDLTRFEASDARAELAHLTSEYNKGAQAAKVYDKEQERVAAGARKIAVDADNAGDKLRQLWAAVAQVQSGNLQMFKGRLLGPDGLPMKPTTVGLEEEQNPLRAAMSLEAAEDYRREVENMRRLMDADWRDPVLGRGDTGSMMRVGANRILETDAGPEVYRLTAAGAQRLTNEVQITEALEDQQRLIERQVAAQGRLAAAEANRERRVEEKTLRDQAEFERKNAGFAGGFRDRFQRNDTSFSTSMGTSVASAAAFSMAYGGLFALQNALRDTLAEFKDYQDSLTDLEVATRDTDAVTTDFVHSLGELARWSGANPGAAMDTAARGIRAFGQPGETDAGQQQAIGSAVNEAATKLALIANKSLQDATGDVIAIGTAYEKTPAQLMQVVDAIANAKMELGGDPAQIAQGLALIAGSATEAGYTLEEAAAVISLVQARTDQSGQAIATRLTRIFQIVQGSTGKALSRELGVDTQAPVKEQIEEYAKIYSAIDTSEAVQSRIASQAGGTANLRELLPLLKENTALQAAFKLALDNTGAANDEFNRKSENLVGTLKRMSGTVKAIQVELSESGLFAPFAIAVEVLDPALSGLNRLLQAYNELNPVLKNMLGLYLNIAAAQKAVAFFKGGEAAGGVLSGLGGSYLGRAGAGVAGEAAVQAAETATMRAAYRARLAAELQMNGTVVAAARGRAVAEAVGTGVESVGGRIRGGLRSTLGRFGVIGGLALGGMAGYDYLRAGQDQREGFASTSRGAYEAWGRIDGKADSLSEAARDLKSAAGEIAKSKSGRLSGDEQADHAEYLEFQSKGLQEVANRVAREQERLAAGQDVGVFGDGVIETVDQLAAGLAALDGSGQTAITRMRLLREALEGEPGQDTTPRYNPEQFASKLMGAITGNVLGSLPAEGDIGIYSGYSQTFSTVDPKTGKPVVTSQPIVDYMGRDEASRELLDSFDPVAFQNAVIAKARGMGLKAGGKLSQEQVDELVKYGLDVIGFSELINGAPDFQQTLNQVVADTMTVTPGAAKTDLLNGTGPLSRQKIIDMLNPKVNEEGQMTWPGMRAMYAERLDSISPKDDGTQRLAELKRQRDWLRLQARRNTGEEIPELMQDIDRAEDAYARAAVDRLERLRVAAQSRKGLSRGAIKEIGVKSLTRQIRAADGNASLMIEVMARADKEALALVRAHLAAAARIAEASRQLLQQFASEAGHVENKLMAEATGRTYAEADSEWDRVASRKGRPSRAQRLLNQFDRRMEEIAVPDKGSNITTGADAHVPPPEDKKAAEDKKKQEAEERAREAEEARQKRAELIAARASVRAARLGGGIAPARAAITAARAQLAIAEKGTIEYYNALASFFSAQASLRDAIAQYRTTRFQLRGDITDPVENARDELRGAQANLRAHRGMGKDVRAEDRLAIRQSRAALEAAKFEQRLSDVQTAEQLGRISFQAYIRYLDNEHDRLSKIKNRTRQQQDQLNQIDLAMKEAMDSADGQFNLGDIRTNGLVYQARRFAAEQRAIVDAAAGMSATAVAAQQNVTINIDGADIAQIRSVLERMIGPNNGARRTVRNRKV